MLFDIERILLFFSKGIFEGNLLHWHFGIIYIVGICVIKVCPYY